MKNEEMEFEQDAELDASTRQALGAFKASLDAWSDAALVRPRAAAVKTAHRSWRLASAWALSVTLLMAASGGVLYQRHEQLVREQQLTATRQAAENQRLLREQQAKAEEEYFANVEKDLSREAPSAMEPLAQPLGEDASK